jgi:hypothetical protein
MASGFVALRRLAISAARRLHETIFEPHCSVGVQCVDALLRRFAFLGVAIAGARGHDESIAAYILLAEPRARRSGESIEGTEIALLRKLHLRIPTPFRNLGFLFGCIDLGAAGCAVWLSNTILQSGSREAMHCGRTHRNESNRKHGGKCTTDFRMDSHKSSYCSKKLTFGQWTHWLLKPGQLQKLKREFVSPSEALKLFFMYFLDKM